MYVRVVGCGLWAVYGGVGPADRKQVDGVHMSMDRVLVEFIPPESLLLLTVRPSSMASPSLIPPIWLFLLLPS